ncbi:MAG TPA: thiamine diphosphokinase [Erysipelotrichaceae bacterium]|nr:thiamine diphosphokinase [Erysipelotrichaceae bacterium]
MSIVLLVCGYHGFIPKCHFDKIIGVDHGAYIIASQGRMMDLAIGDFDSVTKEEFELIQSKSNQVIVLPKEKNMTDSEAALAYTIGFDSVWMTGVFGGRIDHELINLKLMQQDHRLVLLDEHQRVFIAKETVELQKESYTYVSLFPLVQSLISFEGVAYPLQNVLVSPDDLYLVSNEIVNQKAVLRITSGIVMIVMSRDKQN